MGFGFVPVKAFLVSIPPALSPPGRGRSSLDAGWICFLPLLGALALPFHSLAGAAPAPNVPPSNRPAPPEWTARAGFRETALHPRGDKPGFTLTDPKATGVRFVNAIPESRHLTNQILLNGSGLAAGDVDGDGWTDVFFAGFDGDCALYRNLGDWRFEDMTAAAGVALSGYDCTGAVLADLDGDSDLDLLVNTLAQGTLVLFNDGHGKFLRTLPPLAPGRGAMTTAVGDVDGDGYLDLYVTQYRTLALMDMPNTRMTFRKTPEGTVVDTVQGRSSSEPEFAGRFSVNAAGGIEEHGEPDVLFRNLKGARFEEVPWTSGVFLDASGKPLVQPPRDWGLSAMFRDVDHDGRPDLYVCNDFQSPDRLWLNRGDGRLQLAPPLALRRTSLSSMAVDFADINHDGHDDFLVLEMLSRDHGQRMRWVRENFPHVPVVGRYDDRPQIEQNTLQLGRGDGTWSEIAQLAGLEATEWSWGCAFLDVDLDGWEDVLVVNGMERAGRDLDAAEALRANRQRRQLSDREVFEARKVFPRLAPTNIAFRNQGDLTFRDASRDWGFQLAAVSQAIALADLDNDGDADVLVGNLNEPAALYRNDAPGPRVAVRLSGRPPNTRGIGARIEVLGGGRTLSQEMIAGGRYLSGDDPIRTFAAPAAGNLTVRVRWPGGGLSEIGDIRPNTLLEISEPTSDSPAANPAQPPAPAAAAAAAAAPVGSRSPSIRFRDITSALAHRHHEEGFDDYARQPLLPRGMSQAGPGVAWVDLDRDGDDDLVVGSGMNGRLAAFRNEGSGAFQPWPATALAKPLTRDVTALVSLPTPTGPVVFGALSNVEDGAPLGPAVVGWDPARNTMTDLLAATDSSPGPMALADIDGDGDLDLFVGGRVLPARWPAPASSRFFRNENGRFILDSERSRILEELGMVSGAVFTDLDADGDADLALALDCGSPVVLLQEPMGFRNATASLGLAGLVGWWNSIAAGDFDNDGRMDLVAGNWGRNTPYERHRRPDPRKPGQPTEIRIHHGDVNRDGVHDVLETVFASPPGKYVPIQPLTPLAQALPFLRGRFASHARYGEAGIDEILGEALRNAQVASLAWFDSTLFLNRGDTFEVRPLPIEAQTAPVFGLVVADADGDGNEDLFLAQNFFAVPRYTPRYDGGAGLWLRGDGRGGFQAVSTGESGVAIYGEQRGAAVADLDHDGRIDLVVGQNGAETRLFLNEAATPGLRLELAGPPVNPWGVGARVRWKATNSPTREVRLGGGYLSQDSPVLLIARPDGATELEVLWSKDRRATHTIPQAATHVVLRNDGTLEVRPRP